LIKKDSPEDVSKANIGDIKDEPEDTNEWGQDGDISHFLMFGFAESSQRGR
jgi:hypothetical protein